jgi:hypothetical protein
MNINLFAEGRDRDIRACARESEGKGTEIEKKGHSSTLPPRARNHDCHDFELFLWFKGFRS